MGNSYRAIWTVFIAALMLIYHTTATANEPVGLISIQATASEDVVTDTMVAHIAIEDEQSDPAQLAQRINSRMAWAHAIVSEYADVQLIGGNYSSYPVYDKRIFQHWRGSQQFSLKSKNAPQLGQLVGQLQDKLLIKSLSYQISTELSRKTQEQLIKQAIDAFKSRADIVRQQLGSSAYSIYRMDIQTNQQGGPIMPRTRLMMADSMESSVAATLNPGQETILVTVTGTIQLNQAAE